MKVADMHGTVLGALYLYTVGSLSHGLGRAPEYESRNWCTSVFLIYEI